MTKLLASTLLATALAGCVLKDGPDNGAIDQAIPTSSQVQISLPAGQARTVGQLASYYVVTHDATLAFNGGAAWVLVLVHTIVQFPVTSVSGDVYTWGPWSSDALSPAEYKLDVTANADGTYDYTLSGSNKSDSTGFLAVITGHANPNPGPLLGNGTFSLDFDASAEVDPIDNGSNHGQIDATYDLAARTLGLHITSTNSDGSPIDANYNYGSTADGAGNLTFSALADMGGGPALETLVLRSRWLATGAGRADSELSGGDLGSAQAIASQCWDTSFDEVYYTDNVNFLPTEGDPTQCVYTTVDLP